MYNLSDFKNLGFYIEKPGAEECDFTDGKIVLSPKVSEKVKYMLKNPGGNSHNGDFSRQDSAVITSLLSAGYPPADVYTTFFYSNRGKHAAQRKPGHVEDYIKRTIEKAAGFLSEGTRVDVDFAKRRKTIESSGLIISMANEIEVEKTRWIWPSYIPAGKLTILAGDPGMGKSTIVNDIISRISRGTFLPSGNRSVTGTSLIASAEDSPEDTITPRLIAAEANLKKVGVIREVNSEGENKFLSLPRDLQLLKEVLIDKGCRILVIDPLNAFLEKGTDTYKDQDMRLILHPLETIAEETGTSILVVAHLNKKEDTSTLYRVGGSIGFIGAARSVLAVTRMKNGTKVLYSLKCNLAARPASLSYDIAQVKKQRTNGEWLGEAKFSSSNIRWLGEVEFDPFGKEPEGERSKSQVEGTEFLQQLLQDAGELDSEVIFREAKLAGISKPTVQLAKASLDIKIVKRGNNWVWRWPEN